jgi:hypothetical protein
VADDFQRALASLQGFCCFFAVAHHGRSALTSRDHLFCALFVVSGGKV